MHRPTRPIVLRTHRPWAARLLDGLMDRWRALNGRSALHELDHRTLADLGLDRSELSSVAAEASLRAERTRQRIALLGCRHA